MIFDVVHSSFVDGPGVRTVIFFKGCNLRCNWCHNPESHSTARQIMFYPSKCIGCGICKDVCPRKGEYCDLCGTCTQYCPSQAKKICGKIWTVDEVMMKILKDKAFYKKLNGGVTFSGGECMLQIDFLTELLYRCREVGIHTAVDTAGNVPWEYFEKILPYTSAFLYEVKCFSDKLHWKGTGVSNGRIFDNLQRLSECFDGEIIIRIPVIPGYNMDVEEMRKIADFLKEIRYSKIEPLPYHRLGENKNAAVDQEVVRYAVPSKEEMKKVEELFINL